MALYGPGYLEVPWRPPGRTLATPTSWVVPACGRHVGGARVRVTVDGMDGWIDVPIHPSVRSPWLRSLMTIGSRTVEGHMAVHGHMAVPGGTLEASRTASTGTLEVPWRPPGTRTQVPRRYPGGRPGPWYQEVPWRPSWTLVPPGTWRPPGSQDPPSSTWRPPGSQDPPSSTWRYPGGLQVAPSRVLEVPGRPPGSLPGRVLVVPGGLQVPPWQRLEAPDSLSRCSSRYPAEQRLYIGRQGERGRGVPRAR